MHRTPVMLYNRDSRSNYARGGLAAKGSLRDEALAVRGAGRHGDGRLVHVNDDEFEQMKAEYGEPTINPETGMPEFFLGGFGKILGKIAKVALPIAATAIGGPLAGAAVGAGMGALGGGGLKGALIGGIGGGLSGGLGSSLSGLGTSIGGQLATAAPILAKTAASAVPAAVSAVAPTVAADVLKQGLVSAMPALAEDAIAPVVSSVVAPAVSDLAVPLAAAVKPVNWWNRDIGVLGKLGTDLGLKNKHAAIAAGLLGAAGIDALRKKEDTSMPSESRFFGDTFSASGAPTTGGGGTARGTTSYSARPLESYYAKGYAPEYAYLSAKGGAVPENPPMERSSFAVDGPGTGRSDDIPAMLSDGEYVIDAETVSMLGDGSSKAGAKKLDSFRINIRKQKGRKLAKGKISHDAKAPERYMAGGRV